MTERLEGMTVRVEVGAAYPYAWLHRHGPRSTRSTHSHRLLEGEPTGIDSDEEPHHWHKDDGTVAIYWDWAIRDATG